MREVSPESAAIFALRVTIVIEGGIGVGLKSGGQPLQLGPTGVQPLSGDGAEFREKTVHLLENAHP